MNRIATRGVYAGWALACAAQPVPKPFSLPASFPLPPEMEVKEAGQVWDFDQESFELRSPQTSRLVKRTVQGRTWRFALRSIGGRPVGALTLLGRCKAALQEAGWIWEWEERGIARRESGGPEAWLRITAGGGGELKVLLVEPGEPRKLVLPQPGAAPELPKGKEDFPYLPPWPGAKLVASDVSQAPVGIKLREGKEALVMVNFIEKEYQLPAPPSAAEFLASYRAALEAAGWEIEGTMRGASPQIQATYTKQNRDIRATLRLSGDAMGISVADVGAQVPASQKEKP